MPERTTRAILITNPDSGRARRWLFPTVQECSRQGIELMSIHVEMAPDRIATALDRAREDEVTAVLVAGGDGTIGSVARYLVNSPFTLGVIPAGTSNDFARSLYLPMKAREAVGVIARGISTQVDVGEAHGRIFVHAAITGLNVAFAEEAQKLRKYLGRASYPIAALDAYRRRRPFKYRLQAGDAQQTGNAYQIALVNAPVYGGALDLKFARANLTNGRLDVLIVEVLTLQMILKSIPAAVRRQPLRLPGLRSAGVTCVSLETDPPLRLTLDGELDGMTPAAPKVLPGALRVFVSKAFLEDQREHSV